jgi:hypothetical protein
VCVCVCVCVSVLVCMYKYVCKYTIAMIPCLSGWLALLISFEVSYFADI